MKKTHLSATLVTFITALVLLPAEAHSPYAIKQAIISGPEQKSLIVEKLFEEGILTSSDRVRIQIRNKNGAVIAHTQTEAHVGIFCPSLDSCWVFPYSGITVEPMRLDYKALDYSALNTEAHPEEWVAYLSGKSNTFNYSGLDYPHYGDQPSHFSTAHSWLKWLSPLIIIIDNFFAFLTLAILYVLPFVLAPWYLAFALNKKTAVKLLLLIPGASIFIIYCGLLVIVTLSIYLLNLALPIIYCAVIILISICSGIYASKNFRIKPIAKEFEKLDTGQ